jgi:hypothetical protein
LRRAVDADRDQANNEDAVRKEPGWPGFAEPAGIVTIREGSCWLQPPKIKHAVLDYSDDCELLEIILPADFATEELEK